MEAINDKKIGLSTGTCAAAAAKAAVILLLTKERPSAVTLELPGGRQVEIAVASSRITRDQARVTIQKEGSGDPDVTNGIFITATVTPGSEGVAVEGGHGIGIVTKPGLELAVGQAAINPVPRLMITQAVVSGMRAAGRDTRRAHDEHRGFTVTISVPDGNAVAKRTLNGKLGIRGGISILGTTGLVRPMSESAFQAALEPQMRIIRAAGRKACILTPGNKGEKAAQRLFNVDADDIVQISNFPYYSVRLWQELGGQRVVFVGHVGKLIKIAQGKRDTHSKVSPFDPRWLVTFLKRGGHAIEAIQGLESRITASEAIGTLRTSGCGECVDEIASAVSSAAQAWVGDRLQVGTVMTATDGSVIGRDEVSKEVLSEVGRCRSGQSTK